MDWAKAICCAIAELVNQSFGDPSDSRGDTTTVGTSYIPLFSVSRPTLVTMRNTGAVDLQVGANPDSIGQVISAGDVLVLDRFKGSMYARATAGTGTVNWYIWVQNTATL